MTFRVISFCGIIFFMACTWAIPVDDSVTTDPVLDVFHDAAQLPEDEGAHANEAGELQPEASELQPDKAADLNDNLEEKAKTGWRNWQCDRFRGRSTKCVQVWHENFLAKKAEFESDCDGTLEGFDNTNRNLQDCGTPCVFCSFLRACCIGRTVAVKAEYFALGGRRALPGTETETVTVGFQASSTVRLSSTTESNVNLGIGEIFSFGASQTLTAEVSATATAAHTRAVTRTTSQPAGSKLWQLRIKVKDVYGTVRTVDTANTQLTSDHHPPGCMPGSCTDGWRSGSCASGQCNCRSCTSYQGVSQSVGTFRKAKSGYNLNGM